MGRPRQSPPRRRRPIQAPRETDCSAPIICYPGGATYFWWQIGAATRLGELFDLDQVPSSGLSAGALAAVLSRCSIDPQNAHRAAFRLADEAHVFTNPLGLACKWGRLVDEWLQQLLPEDAASRCSGASTVVFTQLTPLPRVAHISNFLSREHLLSCLMGSTHIPFFMDGCFSRPLHSGGATVRAVDGGFLEFFGIATMKALLTFGSGAGRAVVFLDAMRDPVFIDACRAHGWNALSPAGTEHFIEYGARYVEEQAALGAAGELAALLPYLRGRVPAGNAKTTRAGTWRRALPPLPSTRLPHVQPLKVVRVLMITFAALMLVLRLAAYLVVTEETFSYAGRYLDHAHPSSWLPLLSWT